MKGSFKWGEEAIVVLGCEIHDSCLAIFLLATQPKKISTFNNLKMFTP
jgi:hypothetical protein